MGMGRGEKGSLESPDIFSELWRKTEVSLSLFGLNEQGQEVSESCRGKCRMILWKTFSRLELFAFPGDKCPIWTMRDCLEMKCVDSVVLIYLREIT